MSRFGGALFIEPGDGQFVTAAKSPITNLSELIAALRRFALDGAVQTLITEMGVQVNQRLDRIDATLIHHR